MNVLLVDKKVKDYQVFVDSVNETTMPIVYSIKTTKEELLALLPASIDRLAFVFTNSLTTLFLRKRFTDHVEFLNELIASHQIKRMDFLGCNTLPQWSEFYAKLNTVVGASNNTTGNLNYGGDWVMENTREDIETIYFNKNIEYYKYLLDSSYYNTAIIKEGKAWGCGNNSASQLGFPQIRNVSIKDVTRVSCGYDHTFVIADNKLYCSGSNACGQLGTGTTINSRTFTQVTIPNVTNYDMVSCGPLNTFVIADNNKLYCCGYNQYGQLGNGTAPDTFTLTFTPVTIPNVTVTKYTMVSCGDGHIFVIADNKLYCCGGNGNGQLGIVGTDGVNVFSLVTIPNVTNYDMVSCGSHFTFVVADNNKLYSCGDNTSGQLGNGTTTNSNIFTPVNIPNVTVTKYTMVSCGLSYDGLNSTSLIADNKLYSCGDNSLSQIGLSSIYLDYLTEYPGYNIFAITYFKNITIPTVTNYTAVSCGNAYECIIADNELWSCGLNDSGQCGIPIAFTPLSNMKVKSVTCGLYVTMMISDDGYLWCSGLGYRGGGDTIGNCLGLGSIYGVETFTKVPGLSNVTSVSCGLGETYVIANKLLYCSGYNDKGGLGIGVTSVSTFTQVPGLFNVTSVSCGNGFTYVIANNLLWGCGYNNFGQLMNDSTTNVGTFIQINIPTVTTYNMVSCGGAHIFVIADNYTKLYSGGVNNYGQLGNGSINTTSGSVSNPFRLVNTIPNVIKYNMVSCSYNSTFVIADNIAYCCGGNNAGQLGNGNLGINVFTFTKVTEGPVKSPVTSVLANYYHTLVNADKVYACGYNKDGQLGIGTINGLFSSVFEPCLFISSNLYTVKSSYGVNLNLGVGKITTKNLSLYGPTPIMVNDVPYLNINIGGTPYKIRLD